MTRLVVHGELQADAHGPLADGEEDVWSLLVAYGRIFWPPDGQSGWFSGLKAHVSDAPVGDAPLAVIETTRPDGDVLLTSLVLAVAQVLRTCGRLEIAGLGVRTGVSDTEPSWQPRSWIANLAHHTDDADGVTVEVHSPAPEPGAVMPSASNLASRIGDLLSLGGREYSCTATSTPTGLRLLVEGMRWTELHGAYLMDLSVLALHAAGFRGDVTIVARSQSSPSAPF